MRIARLPAVVVLSAGLLILTSTAALAAKPAPAPAPAPAVGYDVSYPQCNRRLPTNPAFGIVGVSDGLAYGRNPCLATELAWASAAPGRPALYMNTGNPGTASTRVNWYAQTSPRPCNLTGAEADCAYDYGYNGAKQAFEYAAAKGVAPATVAWWLDVETANSWSTDTSLNRTDIQGSIDYLTQQQVTSVGIYSTGYQWGQITGGLQLPGQPDWVAGALSAADAATRCGSSFTGGKVQLVQYPSGGFDANNACP